MITVAKKYIISSIFNCSSNCVTRIMADKVQVHTKSGPVEGIEKKTRLGDEYISFQRIPYAKPPVGRLRFKDPEPIDPWTKPLDCTSQGPSCPQYNNIFQRTEGKEDCLHINVFTKNVSPETPLPVMVWIHGGAFCRGSAGTEMYGPDWLIQKDIVLVSLNYRLGALGFLSVNDPKAQVPGNAGLKDQTLALKWIKENVQFFGGDPNNITLFGESAGGCSVHYHMISQMSKNLFHKAIVQSGCALNPWSIGPDHQFPLRLAKALGWDEKDGDEKAMVEFLRDQDAFKIVKAQEKLITPEEIRDQLLFPFGPVIEPYVSEQCIIPTNPVDMCRRAWSRSMPILIGGTSEEGLFSYRSVADNPQKMIDLKDNFTYYVPLELKLKRDDPKSLKFGEGLKDLYFENRPTSKETIPDYVRLMTDYLFWHGVHRTILSRSTSLERGPTYIYRFNYDSVDFNHYRLIICGKGVRGVCHADDLSYLFSNDLEHKAPSASSNDFKVLQTMVELWTNFAITGNPNNPKSPYLKGITWEPLPDNSKTNTTYKVLNIREKLEIFEAPEAKRMAYWDSMYENVELY